MKVLSVYDPKNRVFLQDYTTAPRNVRLLISDWNEHGREAVFGIKRVRTWKKLSDLTKAMTVIKNLGGESLRQYLLDNCVVIETIVRDRRGRGLKASIIELDIKRFVK